MNLFAEKASPKIKVPKNDGERILWAKQHEYDCIVQCPKCGRTQYLEFKNGLANGWSKCCSGLTMPIIWQDANIDAAVKFCFSKAKVTKK
jgi:hypothetical protein